MKAMKLITTLGLATLALVASTDEDEVQSKMAQDNGWRGYVVL